MKKLSFHPIGFVRGDSIVVDKKWSRGLKGLEGFSHIIVISWLHEAKSPKMMVRSSGKIAGPTIGFLATRAARRANPLGISVLKLIQRNGMRLKVAGMDIWDGTPILDIKPYTRRDSVAKFKVPGWVKKWDQSEPDPLRRYG